MINYKWHFVSRALPTKTSTEVHYPLDPNWSREQILQSGVPPLATPRTHISILTKIGENVAENITKILA